MEISKFDSRFSQIQNIKRKFFALRNGALANQLRNTGAPYRIIFGLNQMQLKEIAQSIGKDSALAMELWKEDGVRESRLLAPMIMSVEDINLEMTKQLLDSIQTPEEADTLCNRLLRDMDCAKDIALKHYEENPDIPLKRYAALRLLASNTVKWPHEALQVAISEKECKCPLTITAATILEEDARFYL